MTLNHATPLIDLTKIIPVVWLDNIVPWPKKKPLHSDSPSLDIGQAVYLMFYQMGKLEPIFTPY